MKRAIVLVCALASVTVLTALGVARADDPRVRATADYNEGMDLRASGKTELALAKLRQAHAEYPTAITGLELGRTLMLMGKLRDAREALLSVSRVGPRANESARANNSRAEAAALAVEIASRIPKVRFRHGDLPNVSVDGVVVTDIDTPLELDPGAHDIDITRGEAHDRKHVTLEEGKIEIVELGGARARVDIQTAPLVQTSSRSRAPFWIGLGLTGAAAILGGVSGAVALTNANTASPFCVADKCSASVASNVDAAKTWSTVSTVSFVSAGVFAIATVVLFFVTSGSKSQRAAAHVGTFVVAF